MSSYAIWNNKGGVGKTFVSFVTASAYAANNPGKTVIVIDMCPQANVSEILLGGNGNGAAHLAELLQLRPRRTVGGYFDQRIRTPHAKVGSELSFLTEVAAINNEVPRNLLLVAGDPSLEIQAQAINQIAAQTLPPNTWANVHSWVRDLLESIRARYDDCVFFIDCNPSFAAYTELALLSATRLIVPCTADGSSARAIDNVAQLIYGIGVPEDYRRVNFKARAEEYNMDLPVIHVVPLNRSTQYDKRAARAFGAMYDEIRRRIVALAEQDGNIFASRNTDELFLDIPDAHSVAVVCSHYGMPLHRLRVTRYDVHGKETQVNREPLERYQAALERLIARL